MFCPKPLVIPSLMLLRKLKLKQDKLLGFKKVIPFMGFLFDLFDFDGLGLGDRGSKVYSKYWELSCL